MIVAANLLPTPPADPPAPRAAAPTTSFEDLLAAPAATPAPPAARAAAVPSPTSGAAPAAPAVRTPGATLEAQGPSASGAPDDRTTPPPILPANRLAPLPPSVGAAELLAGGLARPAAAGGAPGQAPTAPTRGFRFDELGMFGEIGAVYASASALHAQPAPSPAASEADDASAISALYGAAAAQGAAAPDMASAPDLEALASPPGDWTPTPGADAPDEAPVATSVRFAALDGDDEVWAGAPGAPADPAAPEADRPVAAEGARVAVHEEDGAVAVLASTTALAPEDHERVWRETESYARELGLDLRELHLNGRTSSRADLSSRGGYGG